MPPCSLPLLLTPYLWRRINIPIGFMPLIRPPPLPALRAKAYQTGSSLLPPAFDPEGWNACNAARLMCKPSQNGPVSVDCVVCSVRHLSSAFSLCVSNAIAALPGQTCASLIYKIISNRELRLQQLSYTRGTVIPLYLEISSEDPAILSSFIFPQVIDCRLKRSLRYKDAEWAEIISHSAEAKWWKPAYDHFDTKNQANCKRLCLRGELPLNSALKPTCKINSFQIDVRMLSTTLSFELM